MSRGLSKFQRRIIKILKREGEIPYKSLFLLLGRDHQRTKDFGRNQEKALLRESLSRTLKLLESKGIVRSKRSVSGGNRREIILLVRTIEEAESLYATH
jgi:hypothetical protein